MVVDGRLDALVPWDGVSGEFGVGQHRSDGAVHPDLDDFFSKPIIKVFTTADGRIEIMQEVFGRDSVFDESLRTKGLSFDFGKREFLFYSRAMNLAFVTEMPPAVIRLQISDVFFTFHILWKDDAAIMKSFQGTKTTAAGIVGYGEIMINDLLDGIVCEVIIAVEDEE